MESLPFISFGHLTEGQGRRGAHRSGRVCPSPHEDDVFSQVILQADILLSIDVIEPYARGQVPRLQ